MLTSLALCALLLNIAYLFGSIPTGYLAGLYLQGIDIREQGSGSTGATNTLRTLGKKAAIAVLLIDVLKGSAAIALIKAYYSFVPLQLIPLSWKPWLVTLAGIVAVLGHSKSIWINFTGGKSVATTLGVLLAMNPVVGFGCLGVFGIVLALSKIVSISSIMGSLSITLLMLLEKEPLAYLLFGIAGGAYIVWRHKANIERLLTGTEPKIGQNLQQQ